MIRKILVIALSVYFVTHCVHGAFASDALRVPAMGVGLSFAAILGLVLGFWLASGFRR